jgi:serine/threonine-protein kinase
LIGTTLAGRYRVERLLGSGGMGAVYQAEHVHMRKAVAVKVLHREMMIVPEIVARFEREAVAAGRIQHPNVASATDFGRLDDGAFYLVLEFVEGHSLTKLLSTEGVLSPERALRITRQIVDALAAAHAANVVHRDLKPDNVMLVSKEGEGDFVKVLDFGIAKVSGEGSGDQPALTKIGTVFGTPEYMSPEQARGEAVDARADLYTVGVILYEMLSGVSPFHDDDLVVTLTKQLTADPPPLSEQIEPMIRDLVTLLLKKNPNERVQTARELLERIDVIFGAPPSSLGLAGTPPGGPVSRSPAVYAPTMQGLSALGAPTAPAPATTLGSLSERRVKLAGRSVPLVALLGGMLFATLAIAALTVGASLIFGHHAETPAPPASVESTAAVKRKDPALAELILRAESGDPTGLAELTARNEKKPTAPAMRALGHGYFKLGQLTAGLAAYEKGAAEFPALAKENTLLADVRRAADDADVSDEALKFSADALGADGMDLIYDVWDTSRTNPAKAAISKRSRAYLDDDAQRGKASPALKILLDVSKAQREGCASAKRWVARVETEGDLRSLPLLKRFDDRRGCGFLGLGDCYGCLRAGKELSTAAKDAGGRPGPTFLLP